MLRADTYLLLASLFRAPPDAEALAGVAALEGGDGEFGDALARLAAAAGEGTPEDIDDEFHDLFIGMGGAELNPYASYYLTGFLHDEPLAALRDEMAALGIARDDGVAEPEDHVAALFEMMCGLITGAFGEPVDLARQQAFFDAHIAPWAVHFFEDLETAESAKFFAPVGTVGKLFLRIESQSFEMAA